MADPKYVKMRVVAEPTSRTFGFRVEVGDIVDAYWCSECQSYHVKGEYFSVAKECLVPAFEFTNEEE